MKVILYCYSFFPVNTGYSNAFQNFARSMSSELKDFEITIVTPCALDGEDEIKIDGINIIRLNSRFKGLGKIGQVLDEIYASKQVQKVFNSIDADALFVETVDQVFFLSSLVKKIAAKTSVRIHATNETELTFFGKGLQYYIRKFFLKHVVSKKIDWFTATNSFHIDFIKRYFLKDNMILAGDKNFFVVPNSINTFKENIIPPEDKIKVFTLGRMDYIGNNQKGFLDVVRAIQTLPLDIVNRFEFTFVGDGDMRASILQRMKNYPNVTFIQSLTHKEVIQSLELSDVVVLASRYEGLSMFALEALSTSNVCLFAKAGGLIDLIDKNGYLFPPQDIEYLAELISSLTNISDEDFISMKERSLNICKERFADKVVASKFEKLCYFVAGK